MISVLFHIPPFPTKNLTKVSEDLLPHSILKCSFSHEALVKTKQKNAVQHGAECGVGGLWIGFSRVKWYRAELTSVAN
jgi:hypothetical protein